MPKTYYVSLEEISFDDHDSASHVNNINDVNELSLLPGDRVLFRKGDIFRGTLQLRSAGTKKNPIKISCFGEGNLPVLNGASLLYSGISPKTRKFTFCKIQAVKQIIINGDLYELARIPAKGFYSIKDGNKHFLEDVNRFQDYGDLSGATARIRVVNWQYETAKIICHEGNRISFDKPLMYSCSPHYGYFLDNKASFLQQPGQWYWDAASQQLEILLRPEHQAGEIVVEAVHFDNAIEISGGAGYVEVEGLEICKYAHAGFFGDEHSHHVSISNCKIHTIQVYGILCSINSHHFNVNRNEIYSVLGRGICTIESSDNRITYNQVSDIGLNPGYGFDGVNNGVGIAVLKTEVTYKLSLEVYQHSINKAGSLINQLMLLEPIVDLPFPDEKFIVEHIKQLVGLEKDNEVLELLLPLIRSEAKAQRLESTRNYIGWNKVSRTGYAGIRVDGSYSTVEYNLIEHTLLHMNDGGALYCWAQNEDYTHHNVFKRNLINQVAGNCEATPNDFSYAYGIYTDNKCHHMEIVENTVVGAVGGILVNDEAHHQIIRANVLYDNQYGLHFSEYFMRGTLSGCIATDNILFAKHRVQRALFIESRISASFNPASFDNNLYGNAYYPYPVLVMENHNGIRVLKELDERGWRKLYPEDSGSEFLATSNHDAGGRRSVILINTESDGKYLLPPSETRWQSLYGKTEAEGVWLEPFQSVVLIEE